MGLRFCFSSAEEGASVEWWASAPFMINYIVEDLDAVLTALREEEACDVDDKTDESELGKFGWVMDPEGNRIELWQPPGKAR